MADYNLTTPLVYDALQYSESSNEAAIVTHVGGSKYAMTPSQAPAVSPSHAQMYVRGGGTAGSTREAYGPWKVVNDTDWVVVNPASAEGEAGSVDVYTNAAFTAKFTAA